ncbi:MAG: copper amine oxidase N-terminal domain-containing protein [Clostridiales bacterium]|nr:copper amine oxidase N-terminal domain-containing protein [Clostridiales bacterium]
MLKKTIISLAVVFTALTVSVSAEYNKYNEASYINISNGTLGDVAAVFSMSVDEFKKEFGLPEDMAEDTNETAAYYSLTLENYAKMIREDIDTVIEHMSSSGDIKLDKSTLLLDAENNQLITNYFSPMTIDEFKKEYGFGDEVNEDTRYGDIRTQLYRKILAGMGTLSYFDENSLLVMLNGRYLDFDVAPIIVNSRTMVPMRAIFEALDATVHWDSDTKTIVATHGGDIITMQVGQNAMFLKDKKIELDVPPEIIDNRTLVPLRAVAEALNTEVFYNTDTKTVVIH